MGEIGLLWGHAPGLLSADWSPRRGGTLTGSNNPSRVRLLGTGSADSAMAVGDLGPSRSLLVALLAPSLVALLVSPTWGRGGLDHGDWDVDRRLPPLPPREDAALVARFVTHVSDWGVLTTISTLEAVRGRSFGDVLSFSDGPPGAGSGVPYVYLSPLMQLVRDLQVRGSVARFPRPGTAGLAATGRSGCEPLKFSPPQRSWVLEIRILNPAQMAVLWLALARRRL